MARLSQDFIERTQELQGTVAARASARVTAWALRSAAHTGDDHFDALARRVTSSPTRLAGLMSGDHDPMLLCALAGRRSTQDLAGVAPAGGRSQAPPTVLESLAARRVQEHWELCRTEPEKAKRLEATWAAGRATMRSGYMGAPLAAMEATFGAACSAEREAAQGRLVSMVPPASWNPAGAHADRLAGYGSARWNRMRAEAVAETEAPVDWRPRRGNVAGERPRARFVARGAGRVEQLADSRFSPRMAVSRIAFQYRLKRAMARGPAATRRFLTSVASNPRRAAAAVRSRLDPMVVAAALGPKAIEGMLAGKPVQAPGPLGRLQQELHKRDVARLEDVRSLRPDAPAGDAPDPAAQREALDGGLASDKGMRDASARFVDKVWRGDTRVGGQGAGWSADSALGEQFEQGHVRGSVYDAWRARREAVVEGAGAPELQQQFGADREDLAAVRGEAARDRAGGDADWMEGEADRRSGVVPSVPESRPRVDPEPVPSRVDPAGGWRMVPRQETPVGGQEQPPSDRESEGFAERYAQTKDLLRDNFPDQFGDPANVAAAGVDSDWEVRPNGARIHKTAEVADTATVEPGVVVGPNVSVEPGAVLREGARIGSGSEIEEGAVVGKDAWVDDSTVRSGATVGAGSVVSGFSEVREGARVGPGSVLSGVCLHTDAQVGAGTFVGQRTTIENGAQVGDNCWIDDPESGSLKASVGPKAQVGNGTFIGSGVHVLGYSQVGADVRLLPGVVVHPRVNIGDGAQIGSKSDIALGVPVPAGVVVPSDTKVTKDNVGSFPEVQQHSRDRGSGAPPAPGTVDFPRPSAGAVDPSKVPGVSVVIPPEALRDVEVKEEDLPKMTQEAEPPPNGSWKVHGDDLVDRVIPLEDGSYEVKFKPGVVALPEGRAEDAASETHKRRTDPELVERQNERTEKTLELERAAQETLADAVEHGRAPFDVERASWSPTQATEAFSQEPVGGLDGDLLRAKAIREGRGDDLRFATRAQIEEAGGHIRKDEQGREAEGVVVMREVSVSARPFGKDGKVDAKAESVDYKVKTPVVMYHVATATDLERGQVPKQAVDPPVPEMTAKDLCEAVGVRTVPAGEKGRTEFQPKAPELDVPSDTIAIGADAGESVGERNGRLVGAAVRATVSPTRDENDARLAGPPKGTYSEDADKRKYEQRLVEVMAADRVAARIGVAYKTSPPVSADEREKFAQMLKSQPARERLGKEVDRVSSWVADGAKERLHARGVETVHERAQGAPRGAGDRGRAEQQREEPAHAR